jgi:hypothetical protein
MDNVNLCESCKKNKIAYCASACNPAYYYGICSDCFMVKTIKMQNNTYDPKLYPYFLVDCKLCNIVVNTKNKPELKMYALQQSSDSCIITCDTCYIGELRKKYNEKKLITNNRNFRKELALLN